MSVCLSTDGPHNFFMLPDLNELLQRAEQASKQKPSGQFFVSSFSHLGSDKRDVKKKPAKSWSIVSSYLYMTS